MFCIILAVCGRRAVLTHGPIGILPGGPTSIEFHANLCIPVNRPSQKSPSALPCQGPIVLEIRPCVDGHYLVAKYVLNDDKKK